MASLLNFLYNIGSTTGEKSEGQVWVDDGQGYPKTKTHRIFKFRTVLKSLCHSEHKLLKAFPSKTLFKGRENALKFCITTKENSK